MNKAELVDALAVRLGEKKTATAALDAVLAEIQTAVAKGDKVSITGFGVFEKRVRAARTARNPRTGEAVKVKKTSVPAFRAGAGFKDMVAAGKAPAPAKKAAVKKVATTGAAKATAKKTTAKATTATKAASKATATRKAAPAKKAPARSAPAKKTASAARKATTARTTATAKTTAKKAPARGTTARKAPARKAR